MTVDVGPSGQGFAPIIQSQLRFCVSIPPLTHHFMQAQFFSFLVKCVQVPFDILLDQFIM